MLRSACGKCLRRLGLIHSSGSLVQLRSTREAAPTGKFEDCYYDCKPVAVGARHRSRATPASPTAEADSRRREGGGCSARPPICSTRPQAALANGNKNLAEQLFSTAELLVGPDALASIAPLFREGAPPRITTPTAKVDAARRAAADDRRQLRRGGRRGEGAAAAAVGARSTGIAADRRQAAREARSALVTLEPASGKWQAAHAEAARSWSSATASSRRTCMAVPVGSTVTFPNFDTVYHNVFSTSPLGAFDLGIYKAGEAREFTFEKEGIIRLGCNLHANMSAYIVVVSRRRTTSSPTTRALRVQAPRAGQVQAARRGASAQGADRAGDHDQGRRRTTSTVGVAGDAPAGRRPTSSEARVASARSSPPAPSVVAAGGAALGYGADAARPSRAHAGMARRPTVASALDGKQLDGDVKAGVRSRAPTLADAAALGGRGVDRRDTDDARSDAASSRSRRGRGEIDRDRPGRRRRQTRGRDAARSPSAARTRTRDRSRAEAATGA